MATEFKVVFEGEISGRFAAQLNAAIQSAVLSLVADHFPNPEGPTPSPTGPGGPVELANRVIINGIIFDPQLEVQPI